MNVLLTAFGFQILCILNGRTVFRIMILYGSRALLSGSLFCNFIVECVHLLGTVLVLRASVIKQEYLARSFVI